MDKVEYHFDRPGQTVGAVSGSRRSWQPGDVKTLPKGELDHVNDAHYQTRPLKPTPETAEEESPEDPAGDEVDATNAAEELAAEHGIDLSTVDGSGKNGRILKPDVESLLAD